jgi:hypothetical protein
MILSEMAIQQGRSTRGQRDPSCATRTGRDAGDWSVRTAPSHRVKNGSALVHDFSPLISGTWRFAVSGIAIVCRSIPGNTMNRDIVSMIASVLAAPGQRRGILDEYDCLAFTPRFIVYTLSIPLAASSP